MTISDTPTKFRYEGNGVTDTFAFEGKAFTAGDLVVEIITRATDALAETLTLSTHYSVTISTDGTASIQITSAPKIPSVLQDIQIRRALSQTQTVSLPTGTKFPAKSVENAIDRAVGLIQDLEEAVNRSVKFSVTSSANLALLPEPVDNCTIAFDGVTGQFKIGPDISDIVDATISAVAAAAAALASQQASALSQTAAANSSTSANTSALLAQDWASLITGLVAATDYSAKAYAIGGVGTETNNAKYWAAQAAALVLGSVIPMTRQASAPSTPSAGISKFYIKTDGFAYLVDDSGVERAVGDGVLLDTQVASSSATINFDSSKITSLYKVYGIKIINLRPATDGAQLLIRASENNGSTVASTSGNYLYFGAGRDSANASVAGGGSTATSIDMGLPVGNATGECLSGQIFLYDPSSSGTFKIFKGAFAGLDADGDGYNIDGGGVYKASTNALNYIRLLMNSGAIASATLELRGYK